MEQAWAIEINNLSFFYDQVAALENVQLHIGPREFISVVGPNGGGKTTLLKILAGLLTPTAGEVRVLGAKPEAVRHRIGYMPQHSYVDPHFPMTAFDLALMGRVTRGHPIGPFNHEDRRMADRVLDRVGLAEAKRRCAFSSLSGGQQQRAFLARALSCEPRLLLLDEPTSNLDIAVEQDLLELLEELNRSMAVVVVSHDLGFASHLVERIVCVNRVVCTHPTAELTPEVMHTLYGSHRIRMVRHEVRGPEKPPQPRWTTPDGASTL